MNFAKNFKFKHRMLCFSFPSRICQNWISRANFPKDFLDFPLFPCPCWFNFFHILNAHFTHSIFPHSPASFLLWASKLFSFNWFPFLPFCEIRFVLVFAELRLLNLVYHILFSNKICLFRLNFQVDRQFGFDCLRFFCF